MKIQKRRVDQILVERGLVDSRTKAQALIMAGKVFAEDGRVDKPGMQLSINALLRVSAQDHPWVGRGGLKLAHALEVFKLDPKDCICLDVGASTGGFTDVLLSNGAARVFAVDVGRGQLAWKLQTNDRVVVMDKTNARYLTRGDIPDDIDLIVCDASFISLKTILPAPLALANAGTRLVALIKPQFEVETVTPSVSFISNSYECIFIIHQDKIIALGYIIHVIPVLLVHFHKSLFDVT